MNFYYLSQEVRAFMGNLEVQNIHKNCFHDGICLCVRACDTVTC